MDHCYFRSDLHPPKRARLDPPDRDLRALYNLFWGKLTSPCIRTVSTKIPDERTLSIEDVPDSTFTVIALPSDVFFPEGQSIILVPTIYERFSTLLDDIDKRWQLVHEEEQPYARFSLDYTTVITGQPGIGENLVFSMRNRRKM
jgi:hypothetical protein